MGRNPDNRHEWFTAGEAAELARRECIVGVPTTESGMIRWIKRATSQDASLVQFLETASRKRAGKKGGGGTEYRWTVFPETMWSALVAEIERRTYGAIRLLNDPKEWFSPNEIAGLAWLARLPSVPHHKTYFVRWLAKRASQDKNGFGAALKDRTEGNFPSPDCLIHMSAFEHDKDLFEALQNEVKYRREHEWQASHPGEEYWCFRR